MKRILLLTMCLLVIQHAFSQSLLDTLESETCKCLNLVNYTKLSKNELLSEFGMCLIKKSEPYKKQLKLQYDIDLDVLSKGTGEKLGKLVALKLVANCDVFKKVIANELNQKDLTDEDKHEFTFNGTVTEVNKNQFYSIKVENENGKAKEFLWLDFVNENDISIQKSKGTYVKIKYIQKEFFDPSVNKYVVFYILNSISKY